MKCLDAVHFVLKASYCLKEQLSFRSLGHDSYNELQSDSAHHILMSNILVIQVSQVTDYRAASPFWSYPFYTSH